MLALQTGLTYIQVCNWFANWRRKLKNAGKDPVAQQHTWSDLIRSYNAHVQGNVEHFSICSDDSIWKEPEEGDDDFYEEDFRCGNDETTNNNNNVEEQDKVQDQCYFISSTTEEAAAMNYYTNSCSTPFSPSTQYQPQQVCSNKYKSHMMEKYLQDCHHQTSETDQHTFEVIREPVRETCTEDSSTMISRWLESAANFRPSQDSYLDWAARQKRKKKSLGRNTDNHKAKVRVAPSASSLQSVHGREELDAAEALTTLANSSRCKTQFATIC
ncbi:unnamed protein product [Acanthoscelides obtectus]|nr:unnamed protein product [Acanthoscelides obtectus]CAK1677994.1 Homeobox protein Mohawk [Acanthoscelides obtectus]